jgi:cellulose synthase/poly-beta-1,6-N-acetylglucosamine synthase-like glycosyltransferase
MAPNMLALGGGPVPSPYCLRNMLDTFILVACFAGCVVLVGFAYVGYPAVIWLLARLFGRDAVPPAVETADLPTVSLLIAAHNEEADIEDRIRNALALRYPPEKLEIVVASDGSTDATEEIVERFAEHGVRLIAFAENRGKAAVLNAAIPLLRGEIVILSDANTQMHPDSARRLATWFADPSVGVVCGKLVLVDPESGRNVDGMYWKYESFLKKCESRLGALLGCNGALYAIRRRLIPRLPEGTIIDDFYLPLEARRRSGCRILLDTDALAWEETAPDIRAEFRRRVRIGAGGYQSIARLWRLLDPRHGWVSFAFLGHKIARWIAPFGLVGALVLNVVLLDSPVFQMILAAQVAFYALALVAGRLPSRPKPLRVLKLATMFVTMNLALLVGFVGWLTGYQRGTWRRTDRVPTHPAADTRTT